MYVGTSPGSVLGKILVLTQNSRANGTDRNTSSARILHDMQVPGVLVHRGKAKVQQLPEIGCRPELHLVQTLSSRYSEPCQEGSGRTAANRAAEEGTRSRYWLLPPRHLNRWYCTDFDSCILYHSSRVPQSSGRPLAYAVGSEWSWTRGGGCAISMRIQSGHCYVFICLINMDRSRVLCYQLLPKALKKLVQNTKATYDSRATSPHDTPQRTTTTKPRTLANHLAGGSSWKSGATALRTAERSVKPPG